MIDKDTENEDDKLVYIGYSENIPLKLLTWFGILISLGTLKLLFFWYPTWYLKATHSETTLRYAEKILVTDLSDKKKSQLICKVNILGLSSIRIISQYTSTNDNNDSQRISGQNFESLSDEQSVLYYADGTYKVLGDILRITHIKRLPYIWDDETQMFKRIVGIGPGLNNYEIHKYSLNSEHQRQILKHAYGDNVIDVPDTPFIVVVLRETFTPFYILQFINALLWGTSGDWTYTGIIFAFTFIIIFLTAGQAKWNEIKLKKAVSSELIYFTVVRDNEEITVASNHLVPGDRIILPERGCKIPCDGIIVAGSCIVNESMLTGESVPMTKTALPMNYKQFCEKEYSNHTIYTGTNLLRIHGSEPLEILVTRTGYSTSQGSIIRSILYPRALDYNFENSVIKFAITLFLLSLLGAIINDIIQIKNKEKAITIILNTVRIAIMLIPAIMPVISASKLIGMRRLMRKKIYCIKPAAFNLAGSITCCCFDKTGTLTEDGLDLYAVVPSSSALFMDAISGENRPGSLEDVFITKAMACCHSIVMIDDNMAGDPIDIKMFNWTNWNFQMIEEMGRNLVSVSPKYDKGYFIKILQQNQFSSNLQRMSVVVQRSDEPKFRLYCKGSPEIITTLSTPDTVPSNLNSLLETYTKRGFRVLGLGTKILGFNSMHELGNTTREVLENNLEFIGLIAFENKLKTQSIPTIEELKNANYKIVMITGDNHQTADSVAKECKIIEDDESLLELIEKDEEVICKISNKNKNISAHNIDNIENGLMGGDYTLSITGNAWRILREKYRHVLPQILIKSAVFARMSSEQKREVIGELSSLGYGTLMCGDGANDCGAIRVADVGISLSQQEASAAAAFTSNVEDISSVTQIIRYGRCSLATSVSFFKYMIMASILQTIMERFLEGMGSNLTSGELTYLILLSNVNFAVWFARADAYMGPLTKTNPLDNVISFPVVFSILSNIFIFFCFQISSYYLVQQFSWYSISKDALTYESYAMFCTVAFQLIILAITQSPGYPFKLPIYRNILLSISILIMIVFGLLITFHCPKFLSDFLNILSPPSLDFPFTLLGLVICNFFIIMLLERILVDKYIYERCVRYPYLIKTQTKQKYITIEEQIQYNYNWALETFKCSYSK